MLAQLTSNKYLKDAFLSLFSMFLTYTKSRKYIARNKKNVHVPMLVLKIRLENIYIRLISKISKDNDLTLFFTIKDVSFYIISLQITQPGVVPMDVKRAPQARDWMVPAVLSCLCCF